MYGKSNVTSAVTITQPSRVESASGAAMRALLLCLTAVVGFSFTLPATRAASGQIDPLIIGPGRGLVAGLVALTLVLVRRERLPSHAQLRSIAVVALTLVVGFPLLTSIALEHVPTDHAVVIIGLTPLVTSTLAVFRNGERPSLAFWLFALLGAGAVVVFGASAHGMSLAPADVMLLTAVLLAALGYSEGSKVAAELGGVRVMCWALVLALPATLACVAYSRWRHPLPMPSMSALAGFAYVSLGSSLAAVVWYRGLALGGVARGSQLQLLQPVLSLVWCAALLHEPMGPATLLAGGAVLASAAGSRWARA